MLLGMDGLVLTSTIEIPFKVISSFFRETFSRKSSIIFFDLSTQSIKKASNSAMVSHIAFLYCLIILFFEEYLDLTCETINSDSSHTLSNLILCLIAKFNPNRKASYSATLFVCSNDYKKEYLNIFLVSEMNKIIAPFPSLLHAPSKNIFQILTWFCWACIPITSVFFNSSFVSWTKKLPKSVSQKHVIWFGSMSSIMYNYLGSLSPLTSFPFTSIVVW